MNFVASMRLPFVFSFASCSELSLASRCTSEVQEKTSAHNEAVVSCQGGSSRAPAPSLRELTRQASDGHDPDAAKNERDDVWRRTTAQRKKCVTLLNVKNPKAAAAYAAAVNKMPAFKNFEGQAGKEHRRMSPEFLI